MPRGSEAPSSDQTVVYDPLQQSSSTDVVFPPSTPLDNPSTTSPLHDHAYPPPAAQPGWDEILSVSVDVQPEPDIHLFGSGSTPYDASTITAAPFSTEIAGIATPKLEDIIKRDVAIYVLSLYFDYVGHARCPLLLRAE